MGDGAHKSSSLKLNLQLFGGGRGKNNLKPDLDAIGDHIVYKRDFVTGNITNYETFKLQTNPRNPNPFEFDKRFDGVGGSHYDKSTGQEIPTPHVHEAINPGGARIPYPNEIPKRR
ncbi:hypothetical protein [Paenibacillus lemnae]|nr:hypothetical protein [Paenibacillus lemnae]